MIPFLISGTLLGLSAGFAPGPLLALVISETLRHGIKSGIKVAVAPILTDLPIIGLTLLILSKVTHFSSLLGIISICGGVLVFHMGFAALKTSSIAFEVADTPENSLRKGIIVNALSPHPYLFWTSVGGPITIKAFHVHLMAAVGFVISLYLLLVGAKIFLAFIVSRSRAFLSGKAYLFIMRCLGVLLMIFACLLFYDGIKLMGWY
ncbi:MAG: LysE family transporter [Desulfobacteraceae bacterium]|nr:LysE family transporter [Desulfobacteraceae bacterium]